jgi:hypothetical protein
MQTQTQRDRILRAIAIELAEHLLYDIDPADRMASYFARRREWSVEIDQDGTGHSWTRVEGIRLSAEEALRVAALAEDLAAGASA